MRKAHTIRFDPEDEWLPLEREAADRGITVSKVVREACREHIERRRGKGNRQPTNPPHARKP